ncbi:MAG: PAS domain-containing protein [Alphaproteobacteria bacterium]|nr:PAS domain-containing protein [Alphaproteobacteria bacterium]
MEAFIPSIQHTIAFWCLGLAVLLFIVSTGMLFYSRLRMNSAARLKSFNRLFFHILEYAPDGYFLWHDDGEGNRSTMCSRRAAVMLGLPTGASSHFSDLRNRFEPESAAKLDDALALLWRGTSMAFALELHVSGRLNPVQVNGARVTDIKGDFVSDILWFKEPARRAKASQGAVNSDMVNKISSLEAIIDALPISIWVHDKAMNVTYSSRRYQEFALPELDLRALGAKARAAKDEKSMPIAAQSGIYMAHEAPFMRNQDGQITATIGWGRHLSHLENNLRDINANFSILKSLLNYCDTPMAVFLPDLTLYDCNQAFLDYGNIRRENLPEQCHFTSFLDALNRSQRLPITRDFSAFKNEEAAVMQDLKPDAPDQSIYNLPDGRVLNRVMARLPGDHGTALLLHDITEITASKQYRQAEDKLVASILEMCPDAAALFWHNGRLRAANRKFAALWDIGEQALAASPLIGEVIALKQPFFPGGASWNKTRELMLGLLTDGQSRQIILTRKDKQEILTSTHYLNPGVLITYAS